jgi:hypothetical protein
MGITIGHFNGGLNPHQTHLQELSHATQIVQATHGNKRLPSNGDVFGVQESFSSASNSAG